MSTSTSRLRHVSLRLPDSFAVFLPALLAALVASAALPVGAAHAQSLDSEGSRYSLQSRTALGMGAASLVGASFLIRTESSTAISMAVPLLALGVSDLALGVAHLRGAGNSERFERRERLARISLLFAGAGVAGFGGYLGSNEAAGAGVGVLSHSATRLLLGLLTPASVRRAMNERGIQAGLSVFPSRAGTTATASLSGTL